MTAILCVAFAVYLVERMRPLVLRYLAAREKVPPIRASTRLPADLQEQASGFKDQWARADAEKRFRELYEELGGDWDQVRALTGNSH